MTRTELLAGILELISRATDIEPKELPLNGALDMLYGQFTTYLRVVNDVEIIAD